MANKYEVKISYITFTFDDRNEAIDFAETAFEKSTDKDRSVRINIVSADEADEEAEA